MSTSARTIMAQHNEIYQIRLSPVTPQQIKGRPMIKLHNYTSKCDSSVLLQPVSN